MLPVTERINQKNNEIENLDGINVKSSSGRDYTAKRPEALSILEYRIANDPANYPLISDGIFEYDFIHDGRKMSPSGKHKGEWLDFKGDHTYTFGKNKNQMGSGRYHYDFEKQLLLMIDDNENVNPQEWEIKRQGDVMIKVGNMVYGNNNFQIKLTQYADVAGMMSVPD